MIYLLKCVGQVNLRKGVKTDAPAVPTGDPHRLPIRTAPSPVRPNGGQHIRAREAIRRRHTARQFRKSMHIVTGELREPPLDPAFVRITFARRGVAAVGAEA